jgi:hypothetical protein
VGVAFEKTPLHPYGELYEANKVGFFYTIPRSTWVKVHRTSLPRAETGRAVESGSILAWSNTDELNMPG